MKLDLRNKLVPAGLSHDDDGDDDDDDDDGDDDDFDDFDDDDDDNDVDDEDCGHMYNAADGLKGGQAALLRQLDEPFIATNCKFLDTNLLEKY